MSIVARGFIEFVIEEALTFVVPRGLTEFVLEEAIPWKDIKIVVEYSYIEELDHKG